MARKNTISAHPMIVDGDMSGDITSSVTDVKNLDKAYIRVTWDIGGSPVGELQFEALQEKDSTSAANDDANWFTLDFGDTLTIDNSETEHQILFESLPFDKLRLKYNSTSGTGTLNAKITAKQVGG